ncbi:uncharacterized protein LOC111134615 isoform X1 [Crassostrea virginica]
MTIYKVNNQEKNEKKDILEQKLLAAVVADSEVPETQVDVDVVPPPRRHSRAWLNLFLILVAILILAAGVTGGVLLYKRLSHRPIVFNGDKTVNKNKIIRGQCGFRAEGQFEEPSPMQNNDIKTNDHKEPYYLPNYQVNQQWNGGKTEIPTINKRPHKHHRHHKPLTHYDLSEDVQVIDDQVERIHMPSFKDFRDTMILHDFQKNYTAIVDYEKRSCYIMKLDRVKVTPPKDWIDLIQKFATGYYMPRAEVLRKQYRVTLPALKDISFLGRYIEKECIYFQTYTMERMVGDHFIAKRNVGVMNGDKGWYSYFEPKLNAYIQMHLIQ